MFTKVFLLWAYISVHITCYSENLEILGYNPVKEDHPSNSKRGEVCVYYRSSLPFRVINIKYLHESFSFELRIGRKCWKFSCLYRSPSQTQDEFETFLKNFELILDRIYENNRFMTVAMTVILMQNIIAGAKLMSLS